MGNRRLAVPIWAGNVAQTRENKMADNAFWVYGAGLLVATAYVPMTSGGSSFTKSVVKTVPLVLFSVASLMVGTPPLLTAALLFSALGDFALSRRGASSFLYGLSAFALAHLLYIMLFWDVVGLPPWDAFAAAPLFAIAMIGIAVSTELWLSPFTDRLRWPVRIYVALIGVMMLAALTLPAALAVVTFGAALFVLSDLILSIQLFRLTENHALYRQAGWAVWVFYVGGQALILLGFLAA